MNFEKSLVCSGKKLSLRTQTGSLALLSIINWSLEPTPSKVQFGTLHRLHLDCARHQFLLAIDFFLSSADFFVLIQVSRVRPFFLGFQRLYWDLLAFVEIRCAYSAPVMIHPNNLGVNLAPSRDFSVDFIQPRSSSRIPAWSSGSPLFVANYRSGSSDPRVLEFRSLHANFHAWHFRWVHRIADRLLVASTNIWFQGWIEVAIHESLKLGIRCRRQPRREDIFFLFHSLWVLVQAVTGATSLMTREWSSAYLGFTDTLIVLVVLVLDFQIDLLLPVFRVLVDNSCEWELAGFGVGLRILSRPIMFCRVNQVWLEALLGNRLPWKIWLKHEVFRVGILLLRTSHALLHSPWLLQVL